MSKEDSDRERASRLASLLDKVKEALGADGVGLTYDEIPAAVLNLAQCDHAMHSHCDAQRRDIARTEAEARRVYRAWRDAEEVMRRCQDACDALLLEGNKQLGNKHGPFSLAEMIIEKNAERLRSKASAYGHSAEILWREMASVSAREVAKPREEESKK